MSCIPGDIREEKNYEYAIRSLSSNTELRLLIAGNPANQSISIHNYKALARDLNVVDRIMWVEQFLADSELAACIN